MSAPLSRFGILERTEGGSESNSRKLNNTGKRKYENIIYSSRFQQKKTAAQGRYDFGNFRDNHRVTLNPCSVFPQIGIKEFKSSRGLHFYIYVDWGTRKNSFFFFIRALLPLLWCSVCFLLYSHVALLRFEKKIIFFFKNSQGNNPNVGQSRKMSKKCLKKQKPSNTLRTL